jgi:hypothetical protein
MAHQELIVAGQRIPSVTEWLDVMDKKYLRGWYAKEELLRCIEELATLREQSTCETVAEDLLVSKRRLRELLAAWRKRVKEKDYAADHKAQAAASIGTDFHDCVEKFLRGETVSPLDPIVRAMFHEFHRFHTEWQFKPVKQEFHVVSKRYVYQGTFDFLGTNTQFDGLGLFDWKTSNKIDDTFGLQIALYAYAYGEQEGWTEQETWERITHGGTVRLDKRTGQLEHKIYDDLPYLFRVASALREPYDYRNKIGVWEADND